MSRTRTRILGEIRAAIVLTISRRLQTLRPWSEKVRDLPAGWLIPIAILFAISFPPLFGHELVALLCGIVYGLWIGFAVVSAGTFLGEGALNLRVLGESNFHVDLDADMAMQLALGMLSSTSSATRRQKWNDQISALPPLRA